MATAIQGAVIAGEKGPTVDYYRKCESCGYVFQVSTTRRTFTQGIKVLSDVPSARMTRKLSLTSSGRVR